MEYAHAGPLDTLLAGTSPSYSAHRLKGSARIAVVFALVALGCRTGREATTGPGPTPPPPPPPPPPACTSGADCHRAAETLADQDPAAADRALARCVECADAPPATYTLMASLRSELGKSDDARRALLDGVRRFPDNGLLWLALGRLEIASDRHREGLQAMATARRLRPDDQNLGDEHDHLLLRFGSDEDRLEAKLQPILLEATGRFELDDKEGALKVLERALSEAQGTSRLTAQVHHRMALVLLSLGRLAEAQAHIDAALAAVPTNVSLRAEVLLSDAEVLLALGKPKEAAEAAQKAISIEPANPLAYANLGISRSMAGDLTGSIDAFEQAFRWGLARRLTPADFLGIPAVEKLKAHARFTGLMRSAWPEHPYPPPAQ